MNRCTQFCRRRAQLSIDIDMSQHCGYQCVDVDNLNKLHTQVPLKNFDPECDAVVDKCKRCAQNSPASGKRPPGPLWGPSPAKLDFFIPWLGLLCTREVFLLFVTYRLLTFLMLVVLLFLRSSSSYIQVHFVHPLITCVVLLSLTLFISFITTFFTLRFAAIAAHSFYVVVELLA